MLETGAPTRTQTADLLIAKSYVIKPNQVLRIDRGQNLTSGNITGVYIKFSLIDFAFRIK